MISLSLETAVASELLLQLRITDKLDSIICFLLSKTDHLLVSNAVFQQKEKTNSSMERVCTNCQYTNMPVYEYGEIEIVTYWNKEELK